MLVKLTHSVELKRMVEYSIFGAEQLVHVRKKAHTQKYSNSFGKYDIS